MISIYEPTFRDWRSIHIDLMWAIRASVKIVNNPCRNEVNISQMEMAFHIFNIKILPIML